MPLYQEIEKSLKGMITASEFELGDRIPPKRELSGTLRVSRMTLRRALEFLIFKGMLERRSTNETFLRKPNVVRSLSSISVQGLATQISVEEGKMGTHLFLLGVRCHLGKELIAFNFKWDRRFFILVA